MIQFKFFDSFSDEKRERILNSLKVVLLLYWLWQWIWRFAFSVRLFFVNSTQILIPFLTKLGGYNTDLLARLLHYGISIQNIHLIILDVVMVILSLMVFRMKKSWMIPVVLWVLAMVVLIPMATNASSFNELINRFHTISIITIPISMYLCFYIAYIIYTIIMNYLENI